MLILAAYTLYFSGGQFMQPKFKRLKTANIDK